MSKPNRREEIIRIRLEIPSVKNEILIRIVEMIKPEFLIMM